MTTFCHSSLPRRQLMSLKRIRQTERWIMRLATCTQILQHGESHFPSYQIVTMHSGRVPDVHSFDVGSPRKKRGGDALWVRKAAGVV